MLVLIVGMRGGSGSEPVMFAGEDAGCVLVCKRMGGLFISAAEKTRRGGVGVRFGNGLEWVVGFIWVGSPGMDGYDGS